MRLLIADSDIDYVTMLAESVRESEWGRKVTIGMMTDTADELLPEKLSAYDAVLVDQAYYSRIAVKPKETLVMLWSEDEAFDRGADVDVPQIYKYQPIHQLIAEVVEAYGAKRGGDKRRIGGATENCRVIAVYSAFGGAGKTTFAAGLSEVIVSAGYRVFYLNMECIPSFAGPTQRGERRFAQVLYHLRRGESEQIRSLILPDVERGYSTFASTEHYDEWLEYKGEEVKQLLQFLRETGDFDCLVLDLETSLSIHTVEAVKLCDDLLWLKKDDAISEYKTDFVTKELGGKMSERLEKTCRPVRLNPNEPRLSKVYMPYLKMLGLMGKLEGEDALG